MLKRAKTKSLSVRRPELPLTDETSQSRHEVIVNALRRCMRLKGYAETSLTELAKAAGMSVSHLLYYFPGKEEVLEELCDDVLGRLRTGITAHQNEPPEERIHVLVDQVFVRHGLEREEFGIALELVALSLHRPTIRKKLTQYNRSVIAYLQDLFSAVPRQAGLSAEDAAEIAGALWMGLFTNSNYDPMLDDGRARRLFRRTLFALANIPNLHSTHALASGRGRSK
jgi:AcrR family transcriptional regulator